MTAGLLTGSTQFALSTTYGWTDVKLSCGFHHPPVLTMQFLTRIHRSLVGEIDREIQNNALWDMPSNAPLLLYIAKQSFINCFTLVRLSQFYTHPRNVLTPYLILAPALISSDPLLWAKLNLGKELKHDKVLRFSDAIAVRTNYLSS